MNIRTLKGLIFQIGPSYKDNYLNLFIAFLLSGMSGLIYQIVWVRMLTRYLGSTTASTSVILCVFMCGLSMGAYFGGKFANRIKKIIITYIIIEISIAVTAMLSTFIIIAGFGNFYIKSYEIFGNSQLLLLIAKIIFTVICLIPSTILMGATLPLLVKFITNTNYGYQKGLGWLYSINTLGAVIGVFIAGFILIGFFGETSSLLIAVMLNLIAALFASRLEKQITKDKLKQVKETKRNIDNISVYPKKIRFWSKTVIFISGFTALSYEIIWTRYLTLPLRTSIYAFSLMLGLFLLGIALGSWISTRLNISIKRPVFTFSCIEIVIGFLTIIGLVLYKYIGIYSQGYMTGSYIGIVTCIIMVFPVAIAFGWQFPIIVRCCISNLSLPGGESGRAYSINTVGSIIGSIATGFLLIPFIGAENTLKILAIVNLLIGCLILHLCPRSEKGKAGFRIPVFITSFIVIFFLAGNTSKIVTLERLRALSGPKTQLYSFKEGIAGTTAAAGVPGNHLERHLLINGQGMTKLISETKLMAHIPMALSGTPKSVLVICFGMGTTLRSAHKHSKKTIKIDGVDIVPNVFDSFKYFHSDSENIVSAPNIKLHSDDGRNFLLVNKNKYDVITIDPAPPIYSAGTVNLYTKEFLELCKERITNNGVVCLWLPPAPMSELLMIMKTFVNVFPGSSLWGGIRNSGFFLIGGHRSMKQTEKSLNDLAERLINIPDLHEWEKTYHNKNVIKAIYLLDPEQFHNIVLNAKEITDDRPYTEFPLWRGALKIDVAYLTADLIRKVKRKNKIQ